MFVSKIFLANSFAWQNNCQIVHLLCVIIINTMHKINQIIFYKQFPSLQLCTHIVLSRTIMINLSRTRVWIISCHLIILWGGVNHCHYCNTQIHSHQICVEESKEAKEDQHITSSNTSWKWIIYNYKEKIQFCYCSWWHKRRKREASCP